METSAKIKRVFTIEEKCTGCNKCIAVCPVDCANQVYRAYDGARKIMVDNEYCIACGACLSVCDHQARDYADDTAAFLKDLEKRIPMTVVVAPAAQVHFAELQRLFGWLKYLGVEKIYDVSYGADLATWAYLRSREADKAPTSIGQSCSAIVNYCQRYMSELLPYLMPIQSPLLCLAIYLRRHLGLTGSIAFLSPCVAKAEEIVDANTENLVNYNVTFKKLQAKLVADEVDLSLYPALDFDGFPAGLGHVYSRPGGFTETIRATEPDIWIRQMESVDRVYPYLQEYWQRLQEGKPVPELLDVLNCSGGCNCGTGTRRNVAPDDMDAMTNAKKAKVRERTLKESAEGIVYSPHAYFDRHLDWRDFQRRYTAEPMASGKFVDEDLEPVFSFLHKKTPQSRNINCHACGYGDCKRFAQALKLAMNVPESCIDYQRSVLKMDMLTGLLNHGGLGEAMENVLRWYRAEPIDLSLIMMDVDDFKSVNDRFGHDVGDVALQTVARAIERNLRATDYAGRWGGDEYMIILPNTSKEAAMTVAERIRQDIAASDVLPGGARFTSSAGIAAAQKGDSSVEFFQRADQALYEAKKHKHRKQ